MTWYANEVIALASPAVVRAIKDDDLLAPFAHQLMPPLEHAWHTPEVVHGLPPTGLLVIRPVCDATPDESPADWYGEPVSDWLLFSPPADPSVSALRTRLAEACSMPIEALPPPGLLSHLKRLAHETQSPFIFYDCSMWGGSGPGASGQPAAFARVLAGAVVPAWALPRKQPSLYAKAIVVALGYNNVIIRG